MQLAYLSTRKQRGLDSANELSPSEVRATGIERCAPFTQLIQRQRAKLRLESLAFRVVDHWRLKKRFRKSLDVQPRSPHDDGHLTARFDVFDPCPSLGGPSRRRKPLHRLGDIDSMVGDQLPLIA